MPEPFRPPPPTMWGLVVDDGTGRDAYLAPPSGQSGWVLPPPVALEPAPGYAFVGFWRRFCAFLIDGFILAIPMYAVLLGLVFGSLSSSLFRTVSESSGFVRDPSTGLLVTSFDRITSLNTSITDIFRWLALAWVLILVIQLLYFAGFWAWRGGTPGQLLLGIQVRRESDGARISFGRGCLRFFGYIVSIWVIYIGLIWVAFDPRKQGWHDKIAGTVVIRRVR